MGLKFPAHCTLGKWNYGSTSGSGIDGHKLTPFILRDGKLFKDGRTRFQQGDWYGVCVDRDSVDTIGLTHGYMQPYGRNLGAFVMSRAARKRGFTTTDWMYNRRKSAPR